MTAPRKGPGFASQRVAANLRRLRDARGLSTYQMADRLTGIGWPVSANAITRTETGHRRVDADDLMAFAIVLDATPSALLMPADYPADANVVVTEVVSPQTRAELTDLWTWSTSDAPLVLLDAKGEPIPHERSYRDEVTWALENAPHRHREVYETIRRHQPPWPQPAEGRKETAR